MIHEHKVEGFTGTIKLRLLKFKERMTTIKTLNLSQKNGEVVISDDDIDRFEKLADIVKKNIHEMNLKHKKSGEVFKSMDDLEYYAEFALIVNDLGAKLLSGVQLGNG